MGEDELRYLLAVAAGPRDPDADPAVDLARARTAQRDRFRRRVRAASGAFALVVVASVGIGLATTSDDASRSGRVSPVQLVDAPLDATPYTFDLTPKGWSVQSQDDNHVTIAPEDGTTSDDPDIFIGKLVIMYDLGTPQAPLVEEDGRGFSVDRSEGYTTIATRTRPGEPAGEVLIQYPDGAGWTLEAMIRFLGSVHLGAGAQPSLG